MEQANQAYNLGDKLPEQNIARVVRIKPGTAKEKSIKVILPQDMNGVTIEGVINYVLKSDLKRKDERIAERVKNEMKGEYGYGITVNSNPAQGNEKIEDYFVNKQTEGGIDYKELEIVVAAEEDGGLGYKLF